MTGLGDIDSMLPTLLMGGGGMTLLSYSQEEGLAGAASVHQKIANIIRKPKKTSTRALLAPVFLVFRFKYTSQGGFVPSGPSQFRCASLERKSAKNHILGKIRESATALVQ